MRSPANLLKRNSATVKSVSLVVVFALVSALVFGFNPQLAHASFEDGAHSSCPHFDKAHQHHHKAASQTNVPTHVTDDPTDYSPGTHDCHCDCAHTFVILAQRKSPIGPPGIAASKARHFEQPMHSHHPNLLDRPPIFFV